MRSRSFTARSRRLLSPLLLACLAVLMPLCRPAQAQTYTNPVHSNADGFITYVAGKYYLLRTAPTNWITIVSASSLAGLSNGAETQVFDTNAVTSSDPPDEPGVYSAGRNYYWSPELYWFSGHWYIYFTLNYFVSGNNSPQQIIEVIQSDSVDPTNPVSSYHKILDPSTGNPVAPLEPEGYYDATILKMPNGSAYLVSTPFNELEIKPMGANPWTFGTETNIATETQSWESDAMEAPEALWHNGQLTLLYTSGWWYGSNYQVGGLRYTGGDPTSSDSWTKLPGPLYVGNESTENFAPGCASPFTSPDGMQTWFVHQGWTSDPGSPGDSGFSDTRTLRVQQLHFRADNTPEFDTPIPLGQPIPLPSGDSGSSLLSGSVYTLANEAAGLNMEDPSGSNTSGTNAILDTAGASTAQDWLLTPSTAGVFSLTNLAGGLDLDSGGSTSGNGTLLQLKPASGASAQAFQFVPQTDGSYTLLNTATSLNVDDPSGSTTAGTKLQLYTPNGNDAQNYTLQPAPDAQGIVSGSLYTITISTDALNLDNPSGSVSPTTLQLYTPNDNAAQNYRIDAVGSGEYTLTNMASGMLRVEDPSGSSSAGQTIHLNYASVAAPQDWLLKREASGAYTIQNAAGGLYLDNTAGSGSDVGSHPQLEAASGLAEQQWTIQPAPNTDGIVPGQKYIVVNEAGGIALSIPNASTSAGTPLDLETVTGGAGQQWRVDLIDNGVYTLTNPNSNMEVDDPSGSDTPGQQLQSYPLNGMTPQEYLFAEQSDGSYTLTNQAANLNLDDPSGTTQSGIKAQLWTANGNVAQNWILQPVLALSYIHATSVSGAAATIDWLTNVTGSATVAYGASASYGSTKTGAASVTSHSVRLTGLAPSTTYHYKVTTVDAYGQTQSSGDQTVTTAIAISSLTLASSSTPGGVTLAGSRVALSAGAKTNSTVVLTSSNPSVAAVPSQETVLAGSASHSFTVTTSTVTSPTTVTITASYGGVTRTAALTVLPSLSSIKLAAASTTGGSSLTGNRLYFAGNVNANTAVSLTSNNTAAATVPSSETILPGSSSHSFTIATKAVTSAQTVTITATSGGVTKTATLTVTP